MDILYLLDRLEEELTGGRSIPFTERKLVDEQECLDILDQIRVAVPEEIKSARKLNQERDQLLASAREEANRLLGEADQTLAGRVSEHAVARAAQDRAADIQDRAEAEAERIKTEAYEYVYRMFEKVRRQVDSLQDAVDRSLEELQPEPQPAPEIRERPGRRLR